jgi:hypothetical protein
MKRSFAVHVLTLAMALSVDAFADEPPPSIAGGGPPAASTGWGAPPTTATKATASIEVTNTADPPAPVTAPTSSHDADHPKEGARKDPLTDATFLSGFRLGYSYIAKNDEPLQSLGGKSLADRTGAKSPHGFLIGYEMLVRLMGHSWLNVILLANGLVAGLEQSKFLPSANGLMGFEINNSLQLGVGAHLTPLKGQEGHVVAAGGWTPRVGNFYIPVHAFFVPDVEGNHRMGVLTGVTW